MQSLADVDMSKDTAGYLVQYYAIVSLCDIVQVETMIDMNNINMHKKWHWNQTNNKKGYSTLKVWI